MPERAADRDDQLADLERVGLADRRRRQAGRVDLDDREVGQGVDAVDRARQDAPVLELDVELLAALDDVVVGQDPAVAVEDDARADAGVGDDAEVAGVGRAGDRDPDDRRADLGGDGDRRRRLVDGHRLDGPDVGRLRRAHRGGRRRAIEDAGRARARRRSRPTRARPTGATRRRASRHGRPSASAGTTATVGGGVGAGSYQRSGVTGVRLAPRPRPIGARLGARRVGRRPAARRTARRVAADGQAGVSVDVEEVEPA